MLVLSSKLNVWAAFHRGDTFVTPYPYIVAIFWDVALGLKPICFPPSNNIKSKKRKRRDLTPIITRKRRQTAAAMVNSGASVSFNNNNKPIDVSVSNAGGVLDIVRAGGVRGSGSTARVRHTRTE